MIGLKGNTGNSAFIQIRCFSNLHYLVPSGLRLFLVSCV